MKRTFSLLLALALTASLLCSCGSQGGSEESPVAVPDTEETAPIEEAEPEEAEAEVPAIEEQEEQEEADYSALVTPVLNERISCPYGEAHYVIPQVNLDSDQAARLNSEVYDRYASYYEATEADPEMGWYDCSEVSYSWAVADEKLSLTIEAYLYPDASGWHEPEVFTIDLSNGSILMRDELLSYFGMSEEEYLAIVKDALGCTFLSPFRDSSIDNILSTDFNRGQYERTIDEDNCSACKLYMNEEGHPAVYATVYSLAGGDYYPYLIDLTTYESSDWYVEQNGSLHRYDGPTEDLSVYRATSEDAGEADRSDEPEAAEETGSDEDYILPESDSRYLTEADIAGMSTEQLQLAVNEIFARHGRIFEKNAAVRAYFESKSWYHGTVPADDFDVSVFNEYESKNIDFLKAHE